MTLKKYDTYAISGYEYATDVSNLIPDFPDEMSVLFFNAEIQLVVVTQT